MPKLSKSNNIRAAANLEALGGFVGNTGVEKTVEDIRKNRVLSREMGRSRTASAMSGGGNFVQAFPKWYDPTEFWDNSGLPWNAQDPEHRKKLIKWLRMYYQTHHLIPILVDIFTRFPLVGIELTCKDQALADFYEEEFMNKMNYDDFLVKMGRDYWCLGEAFALGDFNEDTGTWNYEEIVPVETVEVENFPFLNSKQFSIIPPGYLVDLVKNRRPSEQYKILARDYPDIIPIINKGDNIPVSDQLMKQVAFMINDSDTHGTPILLRALRTLIHEEKLLSAQDAIAERLYAPFILAKMGVQDIGDGTPWFPSQDDLESLRDDIDIALTSEFRLLVHHTGLEINSVFGRENMPRLDSDFDRIDATIMRTFGIHPQLLTGGVSNVPYASSALQAEFLNQILRTYQGYLKRHFRDRALTVAEAQGFYDYHKKGDKRIPIMEEHLIIDEEGNKKIVKKHKLLVPEMKMKVLDLRDEATQRQFLTQLKQSGVPVSDTTFMVGIDTSFEDELERTTEEAIQKTIAQQEGKVKLYKYLRYKGLPVPPALAAEMAQLVGADPTQQDPGGIGVDAPPGPGGPGLPGNPMGSEEFALPGEPGLGGSDIPGGPPGASPIMGPAGTVPEISNERTPLRPPMARVANFDEIDKVVASIEISDKIPDNMVQEGKELVIKLPRAANVLSKPLVDDSRVNDK
jgi:hypothetical protein